MKKFGFTLSELLIALSIVAITSALVAPAYTNMMPDKYKTRVLKYYSMVANATSEMLDNEALYYSRFNEAENGDITESCIGLRCETQPLIAPYNNATYTGANKYRNILVDMLDLQPNGGNFMTPDGAIWNISRNIVANNYATITITFDSNRSTGNYSFAQAQNRQKPNMYIFKVRTDGTVYPGDALTDAYLRNPTSRSKKEDIASANSYLAAGKRY